VFGSGEYKPSSLEGRRLLAHELVHTLQQGSDWSGEPLQVGHADTAAEREARRAEDFVGERASRAQAPGSALSVKTSAPSSLIQRDLMAYKRETTKFISTFSTDALTYEVFSADALKIQAALKSLVAGGKIDAREDKDQIIFSNSGADHEEIVRALSAGGFAKARDMADALENDHSIFLYNSDKVMKMSSIITVTMASQKNVTSKQLERPLTSFERSEAKFVFGKSLDIDRITLAEDSIFGSLNTARSLPGTIYFPPGTFDGRFIGLLVHELTHQWQYQHGKSVAKLIYHALRGKYDYGYEEGLIKAHTAGKKFTDFTTEQQGDILQDYYERARAYNNVSAWQPYVEEVRAA
jgi:hypothetical protein